MQSKKEKCYSAIINKTDFKDNHAKVARKYAIIYRILLSIQRAHVIAKFNPKVCVSAVNSHSLQYQFESSTVVDFDGRSG